MCGMNAISQAIDTAGSVTRLAKILDVSVQAVCFWRDGKRSVPANRCPAIERATGGLVTRQDLRPHDWHLIWPELANSSETLYPHLPPPQEECR